MTTNPDAFAPLQRQAREEIARQINTGKPDAAALVAVGFSWNLAFAISRQIADGAGNASVMWREGLPADVSKKIADAINAAIAARPPVVVPAAKPTSSGAKRGGNAYVPKSKYYYRGDAL